MIGKIIREVYKYEDVVLTNETKVTAHEVTVQNGRVVNISNGIVKVEIDNVEREFNFSIYNFGVNGGTTYNLNNMPDSVDGQKIVKEFVDFVESDIV